jgi:hypothetical protein
MIIQQIRQESRKEDWKKLVDVEDEGKKIHRWREQAPLFMHSTREAREGTIGPH